MTPPLLGARRKDPLDQAYARLQAMLPDKPSRALGWLHDPDTRYVRMPLGIFCVIASFFSFLPVIGIELLPLGMILIAQDIPFLRKPVGKAMIPLLDGADVLIRKWKARRTR